MQLLQIEKLSLSAESIAEVLEFLELWKGEAQSYQSLFKFYEVLAENIQWALSLPEDQRPPVPQLAEWAYKNPFDFYRKYNKPGGYAHWGERTFVAGQDGPKLPEGWRIEGPRRVVSNRVIKILLCDGRTATMWKGKAKDLLGAQRVSGGAPEVITYNLLQKLSLIEGREWQPGELQELPMCCYATLCDYLDKLNFHGNGEGDLSVGP
jgi:hypothetical protein